MTKIFFRADGNATIGLGHLFRCQSLASLLRDDFECIVVTQKGSTQFFSKEQGFHRTVLLDDDLLANDEALFLVADVLTDKDIVVLDGYQFDHGYQIAIKRSGCKLVCVDDTFYQRFAADVVINHSGGIALEDYRAEVYSKLFLGPGFALLNEAFQRIPDAPKVFSALDTAFVCFGGADPLNLTEKTAIACVKTLRFKTIHVVVGGGYLHKDSLTHAVANHQGEAEIHVHQSLSPTAIAKLMQESQLAVCSASTIAYELCRVGIGLIVCAYVDNQQQIYKFLTSERLATPLGNPAHASSDEIASVLESINFEVVNQQLEKQRAVFKDSRPALARVFRKLDQEFDLTVRRADAQDCKTYFDWANDPIVRANSISTAPIPWEDHVKWFDKRIHSRDTFMYICEKAGNPVGHVRFDYAEYKYTINYVIGADFRGQGLSECVLRSAIVALRQDVQGEIALHALVKKGNEASSKAFYRNAFHFDGYVAFPEDPNSYQVFTK